MAYLPEDPSWDAGIYQIETTDPVLGGPNGVSNKPLKNLANRTLHLKGRVETLETSKAPLASPGLTGTPTAPTAAAGDSTNKLATTAFVQAAASTKLNIADIGNYAPTKAGGGAYGTWSINITGNAASASAVPWGGVTGRPTDLGSFTNGPGYVTDAPTKAGGGAYGTWGINVTGAAAALRPPANDGIIWPNDAFGGGGDSASITLESAGGEDTRMVFRLTNDAGDKFQFWNASSGTDGPGLQYWNDGMTLNGHVLLNAANFNNYTPTKSGGGAYGNWDINVTGNAASASAVPWGGVTGRPTDLGSFTNGPGYVTDAPTKAGGGAYGTWGININGLASAVADAGSSKAQNGYIKVPGSNLIIQWGRIEIGDPGLDYFGSISFPIAFPNQIFQVNATPYSYAGTAFDISVGVTAHSLAGFNFTVQEWNNITQNIEVSYIAIGY